MASSPRLEGRVGHTEDHGALPVLRDADPSRVMNSAETVRTVPAKAGQDYADGAAGRTPHIVGSRSSASLGPSGPATTRMW
jgi:hypothetical protein